MFVSTQKKDKTNKQLKPKNGTGEMGNHVVHSEQCGTQKVKNRLATLTFPPSAWTAFSELVRSEQSHVLTASLHLTATLFSLIRQSSAS